MAARGIFLTGTDTGAGKTLVSCAILRALSQRGMRVAAFKPVETGCRGAAGARVGEDCEKLAEASRSAQKPADVAAYLLAEPAAPLVAAEAEGVRIEKSALLDRFRAIANDADFVLVESAGGLMVPIADGWTTRDLARDLALPAVLVVGSRLGCINHALLTIEVLRDSKIPVSGFVINGVGSHDRYAVALRTNRDMIGRFAGVPDLGEMPLVDAAHRGDYDHLASTAERCLDLDRIVAG